MSEDVRSILREVKAGLAVAYGARLRGVYLFGSRARGDAESESDVDVLVVLDRVESYGAEVERTGELVSRLSLESGLNISRVFVAEEDWRQGRTVFLQNVHEEAVPA